MRAAVRRAVLRALATVWLGASALVVATGLAGAAGLVGWSGLVYLVAGVTATVWACAAVWTWTLVETRPHIPRRAHGALPALLVVSWIGLTHLLGSATALCFAAVCLAEPALRRRTRRVLSGSGGMPGARRQVVPVPPPRRPTTRATTPGDPLDDLGHEELQVPDSLTDADLCAAWRSSYVALQRTGTVVARLRTVEMRALYLDLLEQRLGNDFTRWMSSNPRPAGAPRPALDTGPAAGHPRDERR